MLSDFAAAEPHSILGLLQSQYAIDGYSTQFSSQIRSWEEVVLLLQNELHELIAMLPGSACWTILLEFPLYRLWKRLDAVALTGSAIVVIEVKVGERRFIAADERRVEEYALDLRDFHAGTQGASGRAHLMGHGSHSI